MCVNIRITAEDTDQPRLAAVSVKLPPFRPSDPQLWFAQMHVQFATCGITNQQTMFDYVIASLAPEFAAEIRDLILTPPVETPYDVLKETLIKRTTASDQRLLQKLFNAEELIDRKPTQLLHRLQQLAGDTPGADGSFLQELFLQCLPSNVRMVLVLTRNDTPINKLTQLADKIMEVAIPEVAAASVQLNPSEIESLHAEIIDLKQQLNSLKKVSRRARSPYRRRPTSPAPPPQQSSDKICWYQRTFGDSANKCQTPCTYQGNSQASC